jgi:hypothetical protein
MSDRFGRRIGMLLLTVFLSVVHFTQHSLRSGSNSRDGRERLADLVGGEADSWVGSRCNASYYGYSRNSVLV